MQPVPDLIPTFTPLTLDRLSAAPPAIPWLWQGYLAKGNVTLLTGQWKCGKTTLLASLLSRLGSGGQLAGLTVASGRAVVISEESADHWHYRSRKFNFGSHVLWICRPFQSKPTADQWLALIDYLCELRQTQDINLAVIDALASFLPGHTENDSTIMLEALLPLQRLTAQGVALLLLHHPRKGDAAPGRKARGSGALSANVDILIEMDWHASPTEPDRRRRLLAFSRHTDTPRQLVIELNADGTDYRSLGNLAEVEFADRWQHLHPILLAADRKLTRRALRARWPIDQPPPDPATLWRWLDRAVDQGLLLRQGTGRKSDPYYFWLPEKDQQLNETVEDFFARIDREGEEMQRLKAQKPPPPADAPPPEV